MPKKVVVITGGFGVLGRNVAAVAAAGGNLVVTLDIAASPPAELAGQIGAQGMVLGNVDLATPQGAERAMAAVKTRFGRLDALINIAGGFRWETVGDGDPATWDMLYEMNVKTALNASRAALSSLLDSGSGRIVNIGANGATKAISGMGAYAASKGGVHRLTEALAEELKGKGVTVNAVLPSIIDTPANRTDMPDGKFDLWVKPADLAAVIMFLVSDAASAITGALIPVTGGL